MPKFPVLADVAQLGIPISAATQLLAREIYGQGLSAPKFPGVATGSKIGIPIAASTHLQNSSDPASINLIAWGIYGKGAPVLKFPGVAARNTDSRF